MQPAMHDKQSCNIVTPAWYFCGQHHPSVSCLTSFLQSLSLLSPSPFLLLLLLFLVFHFSLVFPYFCSYSSSCFLSLFLFLQSMFFIRLSISLSLPPLSINVPSPLSPYILFPLSISFPLLYILTSSLSLFLPFHLLPSHSPSLLTFPSNLFTFHHSTLVSQFFFFTVSSFLIPVIWFYCSCGHPHSC